MAQLVIQTAFVGDLLLSIPLLKQLREIYPGDSLHLICRKGLGEMMKDLQLVDEVFEVDKKNKSTYKEIKNKLKGQEYENIICPHESIRTALLVNSIKAKNKVGYKSWWNFLFFDHRPKRPMNLPEAMRQLCLLTPINNNFSYKFNSMQTVELFYNPMTKESLGPMTTGAIPNWASMNVRSSVLETSAFADIKDQEIIFMAPGSVWPTKRWRKESFIQLGQMLSDEGYQVVLVGSPDEQVLCEQIALEIPGCINYAGKSSLLELMGIFKKGKLLISNDSGAMHVASVVGLPTVAVFGPTTLNLGYRPWQESAAVAQADLPCRPCGTHGGKKCPLGTHECMKILGVSQVRKSFGIFSLVR